MQAELRLFNILNFHTKEEVTSAYIQRIREEHNRIDKVRTWLNENGYIEIPESLYTGRRLTDYDAVIYEIHGKRYALSEEKQKEWHEKAVAEKIKETAVGVVTVPVADVEAIASKKCACGGSLLKTGICKDSMFGRAGFKYHYECDSCDFDILSKTELDKIEWGSIP